MSSWRCGTTCATSISSRSGSPRNVPVDDVIQFAVADTRAFRTKWIFDEQWLRILDVDAALTARQFADVDGSVTIGVTDTILPANHGVWEISASGAKRLADDAETDLAVDIGQLSAAYPRRNAMGARSSPPGVSRCATHPA